MESQIFFFIIIIVIAGFSYILEPSISRFLSWSIERIIHSIEVCQLKKPNFLKRFRSLSILAPLYISKVPIIGKIGDILILKGLVKWARKVNIEEELKDITPHQQVVAEWLAFESHRNEPYYIDLLQSGYFVCLNRLKETGKVSDRDLIEIISYRLEQVGLLSEYIKHVVSKSVSLTANQISFIIKIYSIYFYNRAYKGGFITS